MKRQGILFAIIVFVSVLYNVSAQELRWGSDVEFATPGGNAGYLHSLVDQQDNIHVLWGEGDGVFVGNIFYIKLDNNGQTIVPRRTVVANLADNPSSSLDTNDNIHVLFTRITPYLPPPAPAQRRTLR